MSQSSDNNKRIAKNTILLYMRMMVLMLIGLYTSRVILQSLGVENYGINNAIAGFFGKQVYDGEKLEDINVKNQSDNINYLIGKEDGSMYYLDPEAAEIAQEVQQRPELKILFDASRKVSADDLELVINMIDRLKKNEGK